MRCGQRRRCWGEMQTPRLIKRGASGPVGPLLVRQISVGRSLRWRFTREAAVRQRVLFEDGRGRRRGCKCSRCVLRRQSVVASLPRKRDRPSGGGVAV